MHFTETYYLSYCISCQSLVHLVIFAHSSHEVFSGAMAGALLGCGYFLLLRRRPSKDDKFQHEKTTTVYKSMSLVCSLLLSTQVINSSSTLQFSVGTLRSSPQGAAAAWPGSAGACQTTSTERWICGKLLRQGLRKGPDLAVSSLARLGNSDGSRLPSFNFNGFHFLSLMGRSWKISNEGGI